MLLASGLRENLKVLCHLSVNAVQRRLEVFGDGRVRLLHHDTGTSSALEQITGDVLLDPFSKALGGPTNIREPTAARKKIHNITLRGCR